MEIVLILVGLLLIVFAHPFFNHIWTILQLIRSLFKKSLDLKQHYGNWAVVTGSSDGIGKSFAHELAKRGLNVVLHGRNSSKLEAVAEEIRQQYGVDSKIIVADLSIGKEAYQVVKDNLQGIEVGILVNNAGIQYSYPMYFGELPEQELWDLLNINMGSYTQMTRIVLPGMVLRNKGAIVNVSSASKFQPLPFMNLYAASKVFIDYFTEALRFEYRHTNLTIQSLCPYYISTKINHFSKDLQHINFFTPDSSTYASRALDSLGHVDNTSGYWPHRLLLLLLCWVPVWIKTQVGGLMYKKFRKDYLKKSPKVICE